MTNKLTDDLAALLDTASTPEFRGIACEAASFLYGTENEEFSLRLENTILDHADADNGDIIYSVQSVLEEYLLAFLLDHRIRMNEGCGIRAMLEVASAVMELPYWQDVDTVIAMCTEDAPEVDKLADMVKLVRHGSAETIASWIAEVNYTFFDRMVELREGGISDLDDTIIPPEQIEKVKLYRDYIGGKLLAFQMIELGYRMGTTFESYLSRLALRLGQMNNKEMAVELGAFLLLARDTWERPLDGWQQHSAVLGLELNEHSDVTTHLAYQFSQLDIFAARKGRKVSPP